MYINTDKNRRFMKSVPSVFARKSEIFKKRGSERAADERELLQKKRYKTAEKLRIECKIKENSAYTVKIYRKRHLPKMLEEKQNAGC